MSNHLQFKEWELAVDSYLAEVSSFSLWDLYSRPGWDPEAVWASVDGDAYLGMEAVMNMFPDIADKFELNWGAADERQVMREEEEASCTM